MPSGTSTVMVRRFSAAVVPVRVAHPLSPCIQTGVPAGQIKCGNGGQFGRKECGAIGRERAGCVALRDGVAENLQRCVPFAQHGLGRGGDLCRRPARALRRGRVGHMLIGKRLPGRIGRILKKAMPGPIREGSEGHDRLDRPRSQQRGEPLVAVLDDWRVADVLVTPALAVDAVEEGVDHHIASIEAELRQKALDAMSRRPNKDPADHRLVLGWILADTEETRGAVESAAMEDRAPFDAKCAIGVNRRRCLIAEGQERLADVTGIKGLGHQTPPFQSSIRETRPVALEAALRRDVGSSRARCSRAGCRGASPI